MYDSVKQFAKALEGLINAKHITTAFLSCDVEDKWQFGDSLANFMKIVSRKFVAVKCSLVALCYGPSRLR